MVEMCCMREESIFFLRAVCFFSENSSEKAKFLFTSDHQLCTASVLGMGAYASSF